MITTQTKVESVGFLLIAKLNGVVLGYHPESKGWVTWRVGVYGGLDNGQYTDSGSMAALAFTDRAHCLMADLSREVSRRLPLSGVTQLQHNEIAEAMPGTITGAVTLYEVQA